MELLMTEEPLHVSVSRLFIKRVINLLLALVLVIILLPLLILIAIITKLSSKGSIIYQQERIGLQGKPFTIYKFRKIGRAHV